MIVSSKSDGPHTDRLTIMGGTSRGSGVDMVAVATAAGVDGAARQFVNREHASLNYGRRIRPSGECASKLIDYFQALNSGDQARWERAFDDTWHPEGIVDGRSVAALRDRHRGRLVAGLSKNIHVIRDIDAYRVEFTIESGTPGSGWKREGPFVATFRDGRIYRLL